MNNKNLFFIFPGQGAQQVGMGSEFCSEKWVEEMWEEANDVLKFDLKNKVLNGPADELKQTRITQPAVYMTEIIINESLRRSGIALTGTAGHSLGEYAAVVASGAISWKEGLELVSFRGHIFEEVASNNPGSMIAVIGLEEDQLNEILNNIEGTSEIVNYNSPGQLVVSVSAAILDEAVIKIKEGGAKIVVPLDVSGGFHSSLMNAAVDPMLKKINEYQFKNTEVDFYSNYSGDRPDGSHEMKDFLVKQVNSPVRWIKIIENIIKNCGEDVQFLEVGPGKVLQGLLKRINRKIKVGGISSKSDIENLVKE